MKSSVRLYDFSTLTAVMIALANLVLICLCAGTAAVSNNPLPGLLVLLLLVALFVAQAWYFLWRSPVLYETGIRQGKRSIDKGNVACEVFYHARYREKTLRFYDKRHPNAKDKTHCITVQATKRNVRCAQAWIGCEISEASDNDQRK